MFNRGRGFEQVAGDWPVMVGVLVGIATGIAISRSMVRAAPTAGRRELRRLEVEVAEALASDPVLGSRPIEVGALTVGIVELTGPVRDEWESKRAVTISRRVAGVTTVLNRLDQQIVEDHLANTQTRYEAQDPSLREAQWQGLRVGTGQRRQGVQTDPARPSDRVPMISRALGTDRAIEQSADRLDKMPTGVEGHSTGPAGPTDRGTAEDSSRQRLGNVPVEPLQDLNPESRVQTSTPKGIELTLGESGVEPNIVE
jgi:hypothetical protein